MTAPATARRSRSSIPWAISAFLLFGAALAMRFPGVVMYDSVFQYEQILTNDYSDWHPPIMARTWALLMRIQAGSAPFFLLQMLLWWGGLGLLSAALGRRARHGAAALVLLTGVAPLWLGWATVILKDAQLACCLVGATGLVAHWRLDGRRLPGWTIAAILLLIGYATLVRANALFATIPLGLALLGWPRLPTLRTRLAAVFVLIAAVIVVSPVINHTLLRANPSGVRNTLPLYDMAGIAHHAALPTIPGLAPSSWARAERMHCYTPFFWDPYGEPHRCGFVADALKLEQGGHLSAAWIGLIVRHPIAYAAHRLAHANSNLRFWVEAREGSADPPVSSEPNAYHLGAPVTAGGSALIAAAHIMAVSPLGWPIFWLAAAAGLLWAGRGAGGGQAELGRALALSGLCMAASFVAISIASDLRYHLWPMVATSLSAILMLDSGAISRRRGAALAALMLAIVAAGTAARLGLAPPSAVATAAAG